MIVTNSTRDELPFSSQHGARIVSLDFNSADGNPSGVEAVVPRDISQDDLIEVRRWALLTYRLFKLAGYDVPLRHGDGIIPEPKRGAPGIIHLEPFFMEDVRAVEIISDNAYEYAGIIALTVGQIKGVTIVPPHTSTDRGAVMSNGVSERELARSLFIPYLEHWSEERIEEIDYTEESIIRAQEPLVTFFESFPDRVNNA